jgi:hypothetical protein
MGQCVYARPYALVAKTSINLNGNSITIDSFDSSDPPFSTFGQYDPNKAKDNGNVASDSGYTNAISAGNAWIRGRVSVGRSGTVSVGANGSIGDGAWITTHTGIKPGWADNTANIVFPDTSLPYSSGLSPTSGFAVIGIVTTNAYPTNSTLLPNPPPASITTNVALAEVYTLPDPIPSDLTTNFGTITVSVLPDPRPEGLTTNTMSVTNVLFPDPGTYLGDVITSGVPVTNTGYPAPGTYVGGVTTNTTTVSTNIYPPAGIYLGPVTTNFNYVTTTSLPLAGYMPPVTTNTAVITNVTYPGSGTYLGTVTTNWNGSHAHIISYTYNQIASYSYSVVTGFSYDVVSGFSYAQIAYRYDLITGYSYSGEIYSYTQTNYSWTVFSSSVTSHVTNHFDNILYSGNYYATSLPGDTVVLGNATLVLPNGFDTTSGHFMVAPGGCVKVYAANSIIIAPNSISNQTSLTRNLVIFGDPTSTTVLISGIGTFIGSVIAPSAHLSLSGGGNGTMTLVGTFAVNSVTLNGHVAVHCDEDFDRLEIFGPTVDSMFFFAYALLGEDMTLSVSASGAEPLQYQWMKYLDTPADQNAAPVPAATNSNLSLVDVDTNAAGHYFVVITDSHGRTTSSQTGSFTVIYRPYITEQPANQNAVVGSSVAFRTTASGSWPDTGFLQYHWKLNGADLPGAGGILTISNVQPANAGYYTVEISTVVGTVTSTPAMLSVYSTAAASLDSASVNVANGNFQFNITGIPGFRYVISATTNLIDWQPIATNLSPFTFVETNAGAFPQRFYRAAYYP